MVFEVPENSLIWIKKNIFLIKQVNKQPVPEDKKNVVKCFWKKKIL